MKYIVYGAGLLLSSLVLINQPTFELFIIKTVLFYGVVCAVFLLIRGDFRRRTSGKKRTIFLVLEIVFAIILLVCAWAFLYFYKNDLDIKFFPRISYYPQTNVILGTCSFHADKEPTVWFRKVGCTEENIVKAVKQRRAYETSYKPACERLCQTSNTDFYLPSGQQHINVYGVQEGYADTGIPGSVACSAFMKCASLQ